MGIVWTIGGNLCNLRFDLAGAGFRGNYSDIVYETAANPKHRYSIVTLNYDLVPESIIAFINANYSGAKASIPIAKLHGSVDSGVIVPPTWSKGINRSIIPAWKDAYKLLSDANHLRIIGYSLPTADAYVKYLLKSAAMNASHLKNIDVVLMDPSGRTRDRYHEFVTFTYHRFRNANVIDYLKMVEQYNKPSDTTVRRIINLENLELAHKQFFD